MRPWHVRQFNILTKQSVGADIVGNQLHGLPDVVETTLLALVSLVFRTAIEVFTPKRNQVLALAFSEALANRPVFPQYENTALSATKAVTSRN